MSVDLGQDLMLAHRLDACGSLRWRACASFASLRLCTASRNSVRKVDNVTQAVFLKSMSGELEAVGFRTEAGFDGLGVRGTLWGGNLCMVSSMLGTPHWPRAKGGVLFLEDVNEHPYRVERGLLQLHQAGVLDAQKAVVVGAFSDFRKSPQPSTR